MVFFFIYLSQNPFDWNYFLEGSISGFFQLIAMIFAMQALETGPGGPIQALINTQVIYQSMIGAIWFDQGLSIYEMIGVGLGLLSAVMITMCDSILEKCSNDGK